VTVAEMLARADAYQVERLVHLVRAWFELKAEIENGPAAEERCFDSPRSSLHPQHFSHRSGFDVPPDTPRPRKISKARIARLKARIETLKEGEDT